MSWLWFVAGLLMFAGLVLVHELGHYLVARRNGVEVEEFGLGFPPRAMIITKKKGTIYTLNWLPFGGFVRLKGEHDADRQKGTFGAASLWAKTKIMLAGVAMNLIVAFVLLTVLAVIGMPQLLDNQFTVKSDTTVSRHEVLVGYVERDSPAAKADLKVRDQLVSIGLPALPAVPITSQDQLPGLTKNLAGQTVQVTVKRHGQTEVKSVSLRRTTDADKDKGYLGISPVDYSLQRSTWSAPLVAAGLVKQFTVTTLKGLGSLIAGVARGHGGQAAAQVTGPVGIVVLIKDNSFLGPQFTLLIVAVVSLTLAIMNALPIPAIDGGRLFTILLHRLLRRPLTAEREELINGIGFVVLLLLIVVVTFIDLKRNFF